MINNLFIASCIGGNVDTLKLVLKLATELNYTKIEWDNTLQLSINYKHNSMIEFVVKQMEVVKPKNRRPISSYETSCLFTKGRYFPHLVKKL